MPPKAARSAPAPLWLRREAAQSRIADARRRGIHRFRIRVAGVAPHDLTWEIGFRQGRPPLLRTHGDRYRGRLTRIPSPVSGETIPRA